MQLYLHPSQLVLGLKSLTLNNGMDMSLYDPIRTIGLFATAGAGAKPA